MQERQQKIYRYVKEKGKATISEIAVYIATQGFNKTSKITILRNLEK